jgi:hypothetical protein
VPTSVFLPIALEEAALDFSAADLGAWAAVCSSWAGWVRRLLRSPTALRWLWSRLLLAHITELNFASFELRNPRSYSVRACYRTLLLEQRARDVTLIRLTLDPTNDFFADDSELARLEPSTVMGIMSDTWAFFANFCDGATSRYHGFDKVLPFRPYLGPEGQYARLRHDETAEMADLVAGMFATINEYMDWVQATEHPTSDNLVLITVLLPSLRECFESMFNFLGIQGFGSEAELRVQMSRERATKLATTLREFACFFPSQEDVHRAASGQAINTGRFESVLEPEPDDEDGNYRFKVIQRSHTFRPWRSWIGESDPFVDHSGTSF